MARQHPSPSTSWRRGCTNGADRAQDLLSPSSSWVNGTTGTRWAEVAAGGVGRRRRTRSPTDSPNPPAPLPLLRQWVAAARGPGAAGFNGKLHTCMLPPIATEKYDQRQLLTSSGSKAHLFFPKQLTFVMYTVAMVVEYSHSFSYYQISMTQLLTTCYYMPRDNLYLKCYL